MNIKATLLSFAFMLSIVSMSVLAQKAQAKGAAGTPVPGQLIVKFDKSVDIDAFTESYKLIDGFKSGLTEVEQLSALSNIYLLSFLQQGTDVDKIIDALQENTLVQAVQLNHYVEERETTPNDAQFGSQWHHVEGADHDIDSDQAWDISTGGYTANGDRIVVCILEGGGSDWNHVDLIDNHWFNSGEIAGNGIDDDGNGYVDDVNGWNASSGTDGISAGGHGTAVSGMIGATGNNNIGVAGVNWSVGLMQVQMGGLTESNVIAAYSYPHTMRNLYNTSNGDQGAFVVATNASWGIDQGNPDNYPVWCAYYDDLGAVGILNCGATANQQFDIDAVGDMPTGCSSDYMVSVTATNNQDVRTFSGYGATTIDLGAPGENVMMTASGNSYGTSSGTSFASPCVAGAIALIYSAPCADLASNALTSPQATADLVKEFIMSGVDPIDQLTSETVSGGRLNVFTSINLAMTNCNPDLGCMDEVACNYSAEAIEDNGNCQYFDLCGVCGGNDSSCTGCTDEEACNYAADNTIEDNSCIYGNGVNMSVGGGDWDGEIGWTVILDGVSVANGGAGSSDLCIGDGCYTLSMTDSYGDGWNGAIYTLTDVATGAVIMTGSLDTAVNTDGGSAGEDYFSINSDDCGLGCTDASACNYDELAAVDNGSCNFDCNGCTDSSACNYDEFATQEDGSCLVNDDCGVCGGDSTTCSGCTDTTACNYDSTASIDDGSCIVGGTGVTLNILTDNYPTETTWSLNDSDGGAVASGGGYVDVATAIQELVCVADGCYTFTIFDAFGDGICCAYGTGSYELLVNGEVITSGGEFATEESTVFCIGDEGSAGCTDVAACNYDSEASIDNGSCNFDCNGCTDSTACNYDGFATQDDGSCLVNDDCGVCGGDNSSCGGCTEPEACNYNADAVFEDGSCIMPDPTFGCGCESLIDVNANLLGGESAESEETSGNGTLTSVSISLDWSSSDGSWPADMLVVISAPNGDCLEFGGFDINSECPSVADYTVAYPADWAGSIAGQYTATVDVSAASLSGDGYWTLSLINGWATSGGSSYNASFVLTGVCPGDFVEVLGCLDSSACNYNSAANTNDDSCEYTSCSGCMDMDACNYDESATTDDGSCDFESCDCPEDVNGDGVISVADILVLLGEFGCSTGCSVDINGDDATNVQDILLLLAAFGSTC